MLTAYGTNTNAESSWHEEFLEETGRQFLSVEEEWEEKTAAVHQLGKREAFVKVHNGELLRIRTADVADVQDEGATARFKQRLLTASPHVQAVVDVQEEIAERRRSLSALVENSEEADRPLNVKTFREKA